MRRSNFCTKSASNTRKLRGRFPDRDTCTAHNNATEAFQFASKSQFQNYYQGCQNEHAGGWISWCVSFSFADAFNRCHAIIVGWWPVEEGGSWGARRGALTEQIIPRKCSIFISVKRWAWNTGCAHFGNLGLNTNQLYAIICRFDSPTSRCQFGNQYQYHLLIHLIFCYEATAKSSSYHRFFKQSDTLVSPFTVNQHRYLIRVSVESFPRKWMTGRNTHWKPRQSPTIHTHTHTRHLVSQSQWGAL